MDRSPESEIVANGVGMLKGRDRVSPRAHSFRDSPLPLILVAGQSPFLVCQVRQKSEACNTSCSHPFTVDDRCTVEEQVEIIPVEVPAFLEFLDQARGSKVSRACQSFSITRRRMSA
jgi:hypothetical protein